MRSTDGLSGSVWMHRPGAPGTAPAARRNLWAIRELITDALLPLGPGLKLDVTLPIASVGAFVGALEDAIAAHDPTARTWVFGHLGDGNLHFNVFPPLETYTARALGPLQRRLVTTVQRCPDKGSHLGAVDKVVDKTPFGEKGRIYGNGIIGLEAQRCRLDTEDCPL